MSLDLLGLAAMPRSVFVAASSYVAQSLFVTSLHFKDIYYNSRDCTLNKKKLIRSGHCLKMSVPPPPTRNLLAGIFSILFHYIVDLSIVASSKVI